MNFISQIINDLTARNNNVWQNTILVFPNRRPAQYVRKHFLHQPTFSGFAPEVVSLEDLISQYSGLRKEDNVALILRLFLLYQQQDGGLTVDRFYPLGETILNDFSEIDNQLVDAKLLFANMSELQQIESGFGLEEEDMQSFLKFWKSFSATELLPMEADFKKLWETLGTLYFEIKKQLGAEKRAFKGMDLRFLLENSRSLDPLRKKTIAICGFNGLSKGEEKLFKYLHSIADVHFYFDADEYYLSRDWHEAGHFMRKNVKTFINRLPNQNLLETEAKNCQIYSVSGVSGMAQLLAKEIADKPDRWNENTAIVLPDEKAVAMLLESLPFDQFTANLTMGYLVTGSPLYSLVEKCLILVAGVRLSGKSPVFYYRDVLSVFQQPLFHFLRKKNVQDTEREILKKNMVQVPAHFLRSKLDHPIWQMLFSDKLVDPVNILPTLLDLILSLEQSQPWDSTPIDGEVKIQLYKQIVRLKDLVGQYLPYCDSETMEKLFRKIMTPLKVPFEGEPLAGVQIMGLLETRSLDFDRIYVLSMNEGILPKSSRHTSMIPHSIRKAFKMNTLDDDDAIYSYHFYRLLQRSTDISLYYNTDIETDSKGEKSRLVLQVEQELAVANRLFSIQKFDYGFNSRRVPTAEFKIWKTESVLHDLSQYELNSSHENPRKLSPSALATFVKSPIQFYFRYVARFAEPEQVLEEMDPITLGNLVHGTMETLYKPHLNALITPELTAHLANDKLQSVLDEQLKIHMGLLPDALTGRSLLFYDIVHRICRNILRNDGETSDLTILALEFSDLDLPFEIMVNGIPKTIMLSGQFDRLDQTEGVMRVVDYKTGKIDVPSDSPLFYDKLFGNGKYAAPLQALYYSYIYLMNHPGNKILPVIYKLQASQNMMVNAFPSPMNLEEMQPFEERFREMLEKIWNAEFPFETKPFSDEANYMMIKPMGY